jgi:hypothetical protein
VGAADAGDIILRRGLSRHEAARYIGIGETKFAQLVNTGRMPKPRRLDGRVIWDRVELDIAFSELPHDAPEEDTWADF